MGILWICYGYPMVPPVRKPDEERIGDAWETESFVKHAIFNERVSGNLQKKSQKVCIYQKKAVSLQRIWVKSHMTDENPCVIPPKSNSN